MSYPQDKRDLIEAILHEKFKDVVFNDGEKFMLEYESGLRLLVTPAGSGATNFQVFDKDAEQPKVNVTLTAKQVEENV